MQMNFFKRAAIGAAVAAAAVAAAPAHADPFLITFDVSGVLSNDEAGAAINQILAMAADPWKRVVGVSWDVTLLADSPSFLSEMEVIVNGGMLSLRPGLGVDAPGTESFSGSTDLVAAGIDFQVGGSGLRLEFAETFDDFLNDWDGQWLRGTLSFNLIPEPASYGLAALALFGIAAGRRRQAKA
jgi:MYXO-CTERM domain-containing protein